MQSVLSLFHFAASACGTKTGILPSLYDNITCEGGTIKLQTVSDVVKIVANVSRMLIALAGGLAVIFILVSAIYYIVSAGDSGRVQRAKDILMHAIIGLLVIVTAYVVVTFVASNF